MHFFLVYLRPKHLNDLNQVQVGISERVRESTLAKTPANESMRVQLDSRKLSDVSHKLNTEESCVCL